MRQQRGMSGVGVNGAAAWRGGIVASLRHQKAVAAYGNRRRSMQR